MEDELREVNWSLEERAKELTCLFGIDRLVEQSGIDLEGILEGIVSLIPPAWQYPEVTCARIIVDEHMSKTDNFKDTEWRQAADIKVSGETRGTVEVYYLEEKPDSYEGPFLKEERDLIDAIAERIGRIIERKRVEEELKQSEKKYRQLIDNALEGVWVIDSEAKTTFVNSRMAEMLGYTEDEMIGKHLFSFMDERGIELATYYLERREKGIEEIHDFEFLRKNGTRVYTRLTTPPIIDEKGNYKGAFAFVTDITEHKKMEKALRESEEHYRTMFDSVSDGILLLNPDDFIIIAANRAALEQLKMVEAEVVGRACYEVTQRCTSPCEPSDHICPVREMMETGRSVTLEHTHYDRDGNPFWVEVSASPVKDDAGNIVHLVHVAKDITERKRIEEALRKSEAK